MTTTGPGRLDFESEARIAYWCVLDSQVSTERIATLGYDVVVVDAQHGAIDRSGLLLNLMSIDAGRRAQGFVRVPSNDAAEIGFALDAGAKGIIVPLIDDAVGARAAVQAVRYPPEGSRSYGPFRSALRVGPLAADANASITCLLMIETPEGLANIDEICSTPGIDGVYIGPSDLSLALGGTGLGDPAIVDAFEAALVRVRAAAAAAGIIAGMHVFTGDDARRRIQEGFRFVSIASDISHLTATAAGHLAAAKSS